MALPATLTDAACAVLTTASPEQKVALGRATADAWRAGALRPLGDVRPPARPARPDRPDLRHPRDMPKRKFTGGDKSRVAMLHAIAHIELNAIDLAWDLIARFGGAAPASESAGQHKGCAAVSNAAPASESAGQYKGCAAVSNAAPDRTFFDDWVKVADEETLHYSLLCDRLADFGATYGDLPAHDGLWQAAEATSDDLLARLAVVPMVLEARGLDVTPNMIANLERTGDQTSADILARIYRDEIGHVRIGNHWFTRLCQMQNLDPAKTWPTLVRTRFAGTLKPPFNTEARMMAGFSPAMYEAPASS
jgi:uncharacterized ferritin-like protein (DUF455 family)